MIQCVVLCVSQNGLSIANRREVLGLQSGLEALQSSPEFRGPVESLDDHHCNDHFALIYETRAEQFTAVIPFVRRGLEQGERCMCVVDEGCRPETLTVMKEAGIDVDAALESGALTFHTIEETYLRDGTFDPDEMIEFYAAEIEEATEEFEALRVTTETTWLQEEGVSIEDFMEYESKINDLFDDEDLIALCQYDRNGFPPEVIRDIIQTHPHLIYDGTVCHNFYYTPPEEFFAPDEPAREIDRTIGTLLDRARAKTTLQERQRFLHEQNEIIASPNRPFEEKLQALFDLGCEQFGLELGAMARVDTETDWFEVEYVSDDHEHFEPGVTLPLSETYCTAATEIKAAGTVSDPCEEGYDDITVYQEFGIRAYLGTYVAVDSGADRTFFFVTSEPREEPFSEEERTFLQLMGQWVKYELERRQREHHQRRLYEIAADADRTFEEKLQGLFELGCERFDLELGGTARIDPATDWFEVERVSGDHDHLIPGAQAPLSQTYCREVADNKSIAGVWEPEADGFDGTMAYEKFGVEAYLGTRIETTGDTDRTLFFVSTESRKTKFSEAERTFLDLMGQWVSYELERRQREGRFAALNDMSRKLMNAETQTEIADITVEHAQGALQLPVTALVHYDKRLGTLSPTAQTPHAEDELPTAKLCAPESGPLWETFVANETRFLDDVAGIDGAGDDITEVVAVPLGREGLFVTATRTSDGFRSAELDFVQATAATVKAAFTRADREQQLSEREATLEEQNRTLERLNRISDIIRSIDQALVDASTRSEIETVVCEQLADVGPYEFAWIGEHDVVTDEIGPREWAGNEKGYLDETAFTADDSPAGEGPSGRAVRTREPQVVNNILNNPPYEPWRQAALNRGYHATIALPLVYEGSLYSVLNVYAREPGVFDDLERSVLAELSDTIAYAINAVESKKALVSDTVTELKFDIQDTDISIVEMGADLGCSITLESVIPRADGKLRVFFSTRGVDLATFADVGSRMPVSGLSLVSEHEENGDLVGVFEALLTDESFYARVLEHSGVPREIVVNDGDAYTLIELAGDAATREFVDTFRTNYPGVKLVAQRTRERTHQSPTEVYAALTDSLTDRQLEVLQTAFFSGYFEKPRTRTGSEIASSLDITQPTFNHHVRAAQRKFFHSLFEDDGSLNITSRGSN